MTGVQTCALPICAEGDVEGGYWAFCCFDKGDRLFEELKRRKTWHGDKGGRSEDRTSGAMKAGIVIGSGIRGPFRIDLWLEMVV